MPLYSTISVIYVIEDAVFFDKRIRYLKACAVENVSKFHFFTGIITPLVFRLLDVNEIQLMNCCQIRSYHVISYPRQTVISHPRQTFESCAKMF